MLGEGPGGLGVPGREGTPGVNDSLVGDQRRGHRPDSEHFSDGRLQQDKAVPVTDGWGAIETYNLVNVMLDPLLQLGARQGGCYQDVSAQEEQGLRRTYCHTQKGKTLPRGGSTTLALLAEDGAAPPKGQSQPLFG